MSMLRRFRPSVPSLGVIPAAIMAAEWLREPSLLWAIGIAGTALLGLFIVRGAGARGLMLLTGTAILAGAVFVSDRWVDRTARHWQAEQAHRVDRTFNRLAGELRGLLRQTEQLAEDASDAAGLDPADAFAALSGALPRVGPEMGVVLFEPTGAPWAWAGRHRVRPEAEGDSLTVRFGRFHAAIEVRRRAANGRIAMASGLLWSDPAVPRPQQGLAAQLGVTAGLTIRVHPPGASPPGVEVFEYTEPTTAGDRVLFTVEPVPPDSAQVVLEVERQASRLVLGVLLTLLLSCLLLSRTTAERYAVLGGVVWGALRAPFGALMGLEGLFSPATYLLNPLRPFTASAGHLAVSGLALLLAVIPLLSRRGQRSGAVSLAGWLLLFVAPFAARYLGQGILAPPLGVSANLWLTWQVALALPLTGLVVGAAGLTAGRVAGRDALVVTMSVIAVFAAAAGSLLLWTPGAGWSWWFTLLWFPALLLTARIAGGWALVATAVVVGGALACVTTFAADLEGRRIMAERDVAGLGEVVDPLATPLLERLADNVHGMAAPSAASSLYLLWRNSDLAGQGFPVRLTIWETDGSRVADLALDSLDLPTPLLAALAREFDPAGGRRVVPVARVPGWHHVLVDRLQNGKVITVAIGPRTELLVPTRLARLLRAPSEGPPAYDLNLSPPQPGGSSSPPDTTWRRDGARLENDRAIEFADGMRHVHASIPLGGAPLLLGRGVLVVALDLALVLAVFATATSGVGLWRRRHFWRRAVGSFRLRLGIALATFFLLPAVGFTAWGLSRLGAETERTRDLLITSVLRDAVLTAGDLLREPPEILADGLEGLANRFETDLLLYSGGRLVATSAPVLEDLGLVEPLVEAQTFERLALGDQLELTRHATSYVAPVRIGYRVAQAGPPGGIGILAMPQLALDWRREQERGDLTVLLLLATLTGLGAALLGAHVAVGSLSRPVADLQRSAAAVGAREPLPLLGDPPVEFEEVFGAFRRMAHDIGETQAALESARQRTDTVLAQVATGVVALGSDGRILVANARARLLLEADLAVGEPLEGRLSADWAPLAGVVRGYAGGAVGPVSREIEVGGRTCRVQLSDLGAGQGGVVITFDDLTEVTQAARVIAWGEMARQVAHEIKNPLTPIRLGVQHLRRVQRERPDQLAQTLDQTTERILGEIERLDTIARAFSRFGLPGQGLPSLVGIDLRDAGLEVAALYRLGEGGPSLSVEGGGPRQQARLDEVKEVLGNLVENARNAGASQVVIRVRGDGLEVEDDGSGIPDDMLQRIFEPHFSTTTSGSGLGLAIVRRLVDGWGATVSAASAARRGTIISIRWPRGPS